MTDDINSPLAAIRDWVRQAAEVGASDLHLVAGYPPTLRLNGMMRALAEPQLDAAEAEAALKALSPASAVAQLMARSDVDFSAEVPIGGGKKVRVRANLFKAGGRLGGCLRLVPAAIPGFDWAGFPVELADKLTALRDGLVIVAGATGSGKTTTLAMLVRRLAQAGGCRILTVEEPVEYQFSAGPGAVISQREVGRDVASFADGLKYGLRQDPDVILVGEVRDRDTAQMALSAAETGHLVLTTLHTRDAKGAISRLADLFPQDAQKDVRGQLALALRAVVGQRLLSSASGGKQVLAVEVLWNTHPIASAVRLGKLESVDNYIQTGREDGMVSFDESVRVLWRAGRIGKATAERNVSDPGVLSR